MNKKIIGIFLCGLFFVSAYSSASNLNTENMNAENIEFIIELDNLPETLIFNQEGVENGVNEYSWTISIDTDGNVSTGSTWSGMEGIDTTINIYNIKKSSQQLEDTIINQCSFWTMSWDNRGWFGGVHQISQKYVDSEKDLIILYCQKSWSEISKIDLSDRIHINTFHVTKDGWESDNATGIGFITDSVGEVSYSFNDIVRGGISMPTIPEIKGDTSGKAGKEITYTFSSTDTIGNDLYYYVEWGDGEIDEWVGPFVSGEAVELTHVWNEEGNYSIKAQAKSSKDVLSNWGTLPITIPCSYNKPIL
jgi:hypothetical protein